jgi:allantoin racemase
MALRLFYIEPTNVPLFGAHLVRNLQRFAGRDAVVEWDYLPGPPGEPPSPYLPEKPFYLGDMYRRLWQAEQEDYDAVIIGCADDPGIGEARRMLHIPAIGLLQAGLHAGCLVAERLSVITPTLPENPLGFAGIIWERARDYGLDGRIASVLPAIVDNPSGEAFAALLAQSEDAARAAVLDSFRDALERDVADKVRLAVERDGAEAVYLACGHWTGMLQPLAAQFSVPLLDPGACAVRLAEAAAVARGGA